MVDNIETIKPFLKFNSDDDFYYLQLIRRKKENLSLSNNSKVVKNYYIDSIGYLESKYDEIKYLCDYFNARAYIRLNVRSYEQCSYQLLKQVTDQILNKAFRHCRRSAFNREAGRFNNAEVRKWVIDIDGEWNQSQIETIIKEVNNIQPIGVKCLGHIPTKNGVHIIITPFRSDVFKRNHPDIDVHKDNPTILYSI